MEKGNTDWSRSVAGVVIREGKVLLARHTYGGGKGMLIVPGGYLEQGEMPQNAVKRELLEETGVMVEPVKLLAMRFSEKDWYAAFLAEYVSGEAVSDGDENSEVLWVEAKEALSREDVPGLTKQLIRYALKGGGFTPLAYESKNGKIENSLYGTDGLLRVEEREESICR